MSTKVAAATTHGQLIDLHENYYGFWKGIERKQRHSYVLTPHTFDLTPYMVKQLDEIGILVADYQNGLRGMYQHLTENVDNDPIAGMFRRVLKNAASGMEIQSSDRNVPICKVDVMVGADDRLYIAEIDTYNPRGIPFSIFLQDIQYQIDAANKQSLYPGTIPILLDFLDGSDTWYWCYAHKERYYKPSFDILAQVLERDYGITTKLIDLETHALKDSQLPSNAKFSIIPWGCHYDTEKRNVKFLEELYKRKPENFLYPPTPWTSSKGWLALVADPLQKKEFEFYQQFFKQNSLFTKYIPETVLLTKRFMGDADLFQQQYTNVILKENVSSGMKGVLTAGDALFAQKIQEANKMKNPNWTLQRLLDQKTFSIPYYDEKGVEQEKDWYLRICVYVAGDGRILDAEITARPEPDVHGAPDCLMTSCTK